MVEDGLYVVYVDCLTPLTRPQAVTLADVLGPRATVVNHHAEGLRYGRRYTVRVGPFDFTREAEAEARALLDLWP